MTKLKNKKLKMLFGIPILYLVFVGLIFFSVSTGIIAKSPPPPIEIVTTDTIADYSSISILSHLKSAESFFENNFLRNEGHIDLYIAEGSDANGKDNDTNSEAISYYLLWKAVSKDKESFDRELEFLSNYMLHPKFGYLMWRLDENGLVVDDGSNIATDADLRTIKALLIAENQWGDEKYTQMIDTIAFGIEKVAITEDFYLAPYGGVSGENSTWTANEVWLSYGDFTVFNELAERRGSPWDKIYYNMKEATLDAQIANGLYNSMLTEKRDYGNGIDAGGYSINSMWVMIRSAESGNGELKRSANKSLQFYKNKFIVDAEIYAQYGSNGDALSPSDTPWVYALVGRAAVALDDKSFSEEMIQKLIEHQITDNQSKLYGAFPEGYGNQTRVGQFTMQESIITLHDFNRKYWLK